MWSAIREGVAVRLEEGAAAGSWEEGNKTTGAILLE